MIAPIHLIAKDVALAALKAHAEGRLSAQGPTPTCAYRDDSGFPCAIGAALTDADAARCGAGWVTEICGLVRDGIVSTDDLDALSDLQRAHDSWSDRSSDVLDGESDFLATARRIAGVE